MTKTAARNFVRSRPGASSLLALLLALILPTVAPAAPAATPAPRDDDRSRNLLAHGTEQSLWCADVLPQPAGNAAATRTVIRFRGAGDPQWRVLAEVAAEAVHLGSRGSELLVVLADGEWRLVADGSVRSGSALPLRANVLALAGDGDEIWAIGAAPPGLLLQTGNPPATSPTTAATTAAADASHAAAPTTAQSPQPSSPPLPPHDLALFHYRLGAWSEVDLLPGGLRRADLVAVSMAVLEGRVTVALATTDRAIRVYSRTSSGQAWQDGTDVATLGERGRMKLTELNGQPLLWVADDRGPGFIHLGGRAWSQPIRLQVSPKLAEFDRSALAVGLGRLRLIASDGRRRLAEQIYNSDGTPAGDATEAQTAQSPLDNRIAHVMQLIVMAVLLVWIIGAMRQRPNLQEAMQKLDQLRLAPLSRRFLGGLIDALPLFVAALVAERLAAAGERTLDSVLTLTSPEVVSLSTGLGVYLLHVTVMELLFARSVGKMLSGTRVAGLDGSRPSASAILMRNVLRIVDVVLLFPPIFVIFSPLRQRVGDMAGGTIVVIHGVADQPPATAKPEESPADTPPSPPGPPTG